MSKSRHSITIYQQGETVEGVTLRHAAGGAFSGVTADIRTPESKKPDSRHVLTNIDKAVEQFLAMEAQGISGPLFAG